ncbi:MAG: N-acetyl-D-Glu racemase DgcA [Candidatus Latescibacterota bacterium]|nr:N-acetyl-D-Glu racemase DgcA [Candidatus Latescibacterota bacterium]
MKLTVHRESWPLSKIFSISRGQKQNADVVICTLRENDFEGRGECVPYPRYGESVEQTIQTIKDIRPHIESGLDFYTLQYLLPAGAARNAVDCALWDLRAKQAKKSTYELAHINIPKPVETAYTISLDTPRKMGKDALANSHRPLLKLKLDGKRDLERVAAVREHAPTSTLIVDANEGWHEKDVLPMAAKLAQLGVALLEQPLPSGKDEILENIARPLPFCADESCHTSHNLEQLVARYDCVNIKLDKTGGLTEALLLLKRAQEYSLDIMVGCMVSTSLSIAPATLLTASAKYVDLDGPLLLKHDRSDGLYYEDSILFPNFDSLWG